MYKNFFKRKFCHKKKLISNSLINVSLKLKFLSLSVGNELIKARRSKLILKSLLA